MAWEKMYRSSIIPASPERRAVLKSHGLTDEDIDKRDNQEVWQNNIYTALVDRHAEGFVLELSIRRNDRQAVHDWRDLQMVKNDIAGPEVEAFEMYPAMSRIMDTSNQYYLFCLPPGEMLPAGWAGRPNLVDTGELADIGAVQRPLPEEWLEYKQ